MRFLRQSTATAVLVGPFLDDTDGKTAETALTVASIDVDVYKHSDTHPLTKTDITPAASGSSNDMAHVANGYYSLELTAGNTDTLGRFELTANISGALPVWHEFMVLPANVFDSLFGSDKLDVAVVEMSAGVVTATVIADGAIDAGAIADNAITAAKIAADAIGASELAADAVTEIAAAVAAPSAATIASTLLAATNTSSNSQTTVGGQLRRAHALAGGTEVSKDHAAANPTWVHRNEADSADLITRTRTVSGDVETVTPS